MGIALPVTARTAPMTALVVNEYFILKDIVPLSRNLEIEEMYGIFVKI